MSDPVTNVELEDVLSSIRRLVADRDAPLPRVATEPDRLLLTAALRVSEEAEYRSAMPLPLAPWAASDPVPITEPEPLSDDAAGAVARLAAQIEAAVTVQDSEFEPDGSEDVPVMDWSAPPADDAPVFRSRLQGAGLRLVDVAPDDPVFQHRGADLPLADAPLDGADEGADDLAEDLRFSHADRLDDDPDASLDALFGPQAAIDEALLRQIVTEVVRQELQGTLGERITRNVRKLVRREIYRVLDSERLE